MFPSSKKKRNPNAVLFSETQDSEEKAEYLAEEAGVKAWTLQYLGKSQSIAILHISWKSATHH